MTADRVRAEKLYMALEGMLLIALNNLYDTPRRESNRVAFLDAVEAIAEAARKK